MLYYSHKFYKNHPARIEEKGFDCLLKTPQDVRAIVKARPAAVKGTYIKGITVATTMGVGIQIDPAQAQKEVAAAD